MSQLILYSNSTSNPQTLDLTGYMNVNDTTMNPDDPNMTSKIWGHSLQKQGATLALEQLVEREPVFPLLLGPVGGLAGAPTNMSQTLALIQRINQIGRISGATLVWQPLGASQATTFDVLSIQVDVNYDYWKENQYWTSVTMRVFTEPLGRTAGPRVYAAASGVGPLLMISPYASGGALATVASGTGFGASGGKFGPNGASGGISYFGNPSLAGDAPAQLQISYVGPFSSGLGPGEVPKVAISLLPDQYYQPLYQVTALGGDLTPRVASGAVASQYGTVGGAASAAGYITFPTTQGSPGITPGALWAGQHRIFAIARASHTPGYLTSPAYGPIAYPTTATVAAGDWDLYDLGTFSIRPSEYSQAPISIQAFAPSPCALDVTAIVTLPDANTWFVAGATAIASQYVSGFVENIVPIGHQNAILCDDVLGDQFIYGAGGFFSVGFAPSPIGMAASSTRITPETRGLVPQPDPKNGLPCIAILGVGNWCIASSAYLGAAASTSNAQNQPVNAQVNVLERFRYVSG